MDAMTHNLMAATIAATAAMFSGIGAGSLCGYLLGVDTVGLRGTALLVGLFTTLAMFCSLLWLAYNGFQR